MEPYDDDMYVDTIVVYSLVAEADSEADENVVDGVPGDPVACAVDDPTLAPTLMSGVEPGSRDVVTIYCPADPGVRGANQLIEQVAGHGVAIDPPRRLRSTAEARPPSNVFPSWTVTAQWLNG